MTINEMHIAVSLGVQKIASFQADNLLPEEIDHEINLAILRFVKQRYSQLSNRIGKGFEQSQKRIDDIRTLVVELAGDTFNVGNAADVTGSYVYTATNSNIYVDRYTLPLDYLFLVSVRAHVSYLCNTQLTPPTLQIITTIVDQVLLDLTPPGPGYKLVDVRGSLGSGWQSIFNNPLGSGNEIIFEDLIDSQNYNVVGIVPQSNFPQESYTSSFSTNASPVLESNKLYLKSSVYTWTELDGGFVKLVWRYNNNPNSDIEVIQQKRQTVQNTKRTAPDASYRISLCKYAQHDDIIYMMNDPFNITDYRSPLYTIEEDYIDVYTDYSFVTPKVIIKYLRTPGKVSIINGLGCDLPDHTHPEIVEMTIKSILEGIESQRYQSQSMETFESE